MKLITRQQWGARPPDSITALYATGCTAHWEGPHMGTFPHDACAAKVREIQRYHMDVKGWTDIAYNAIACPHGYVYEGRGPGRRSAANGTDQGNDADYAACYLGGEGDPFTHEGAQAMADAMHWLSPGGQRHAHRDWKPTACPGDTIAAWAHSPAALHPGAPDNGGFGTMTDAEIDAKFLKLQTEHDATQAKLDALTEKVDELHEQAQKHNKAARDRDAKLLAALDKPAA